MIEEYFQSHVVMKSTIPAIEVDEKGLVCRFFEAADIEGHAMFDVTPDGKPVITLPRPAVVKRTDLYYLRARAMYRVVLHLKQIQDLPEGVQCSIELMSHVAGTMSLLAYEIVQGLIFMYIVPQVPVQISPFFPIAHLCFSGSSVDAISAGKKEDKKKDDKKKDDKKVEPPASSEKKDDTEKK